MRFITVFVLVAGLGALPAVAQTSCRITNAADGKQSFVRGDVTGTNLSMLVTENGPVPARLTLDAVSAYSQVPVGSPTLKVFRAGNSVEGKDWPDPVSVETVDAGLLMSWPAFNLRGAPVKNLKIGLSSGWTKKQQKISHPAKHSGPTAIFLRLDGRLGAPPNSELVETDYSELNQWRSAASGRQTFKVDVFDADAGVHIAAIDFTIPDSESTQARPISDVTALRRAVAESNCNRTS